LFKIAPHHLKGVNSMSVQENTRIIEKWIAAVNSKDYDGYLDLFSDDIVSTSTATSEPAQGKEAIRQQLAGTHAAFPDYYLKLENSVVADDQFVCEIGVSGTHIEELNLGPGAPSIPATGKRFRTQGIFVATVDSGKVTEFHIYPDIMGLMRQLGLMSPPQGE
jgi:steroid delta-isomerase-like uncharacterized protein